MKSKALLFAGQILVGMLFSGSALAQVALGYTGETTGGGRMPCYDYNNYISGVDSPVVGGWVGPRFRVLSRYYNTCPGGEGSCYTTESVIYSGVPTAMFGRVCIGSKYTVYGTQTFVGCPPNTAAIETADYKRSDGVTHSGFVTLCVKTDTQ